MGMFKKEMSMPQALFEIGLEEVPARFVDGCLRDLAQLIQKKVVSARLNTPETTIRSMATYRRLTVIVDDILTEQVAIDDTVEGPPIRIAKNDAGEWLPPAIGFAKKSGAHVDDLREITNKKGQVVVVVDRHLPGQTAMALLPDIYASAVAEMARPIAMVWGNNIGPFIRPIQWLCALLDTEVVPVTIFGVSSTHQSRGHRFLTTGDDYSSGKAIDIASPSHYVAALKTHHVMVDPTERQAVIEDQLWGYLKVIDSALLNEVVHLAESPTVLCVPFSADFLALPKDVLISCLKKHQKAFVVAGDDGQLRPECLIIADNVTDENKATIIEGNQRVMLARLNDVQFFWNEDLAVQGFSRWNDQLNHIVFQEGVGTMADKVERLCHISHTMMDQLPIEKSFRDAVDRAAHCAKADLVSQMVGELPNLQGIMGGYYATLFKEDVVVSSAIRDHYKPRFDGDDMPDNLGAIIIGIADRLDTMVACFETNAIPTGSRDPWGIRRSMIAIVRIVLTHQLPLNLDLLIEDATLTLDRPIGDATQKCREFFKKRVEWVLLDEGLPVDMVQWAAAHWLSAPRRCFDRIQWLQTLKNNTPDIYRLLVDTSGRVQKLMAKGNEVSGDICETQFEHDIEATALSTFNALKTALVSQDLTSDTGILLVDFCQQLVTYFEQVLVNADCPHVAKNRRLFMQQVMHCFLSLGDWGALKK
jgi:glycyl-tRNA synthetase beta chain